MRQGAVTCVDLASISRRRMRLRGEKQEHVRRGDGGNGAQLKRRGRKGEKKQYLGRSVLIAEVASEIVANRHLPPPSVRALAAAGRCLGVVCEETAMVGGLLRIASSTVCL